MNWTEKQRRVIEFRGGNLLVSAAAGSGKTAVLVEHILRRISDPGEGCDITDLLVVTFTRAAAAEMKERLSNRLLALLEEEPDNRHLARQIPLLAQAHICTIDSFCQWMVKNHFYDLDIDPDFRVMEEGEGKLLRQEVLEELLEDSFREAEEDFLLLADTFGSVRGDASLRELVLRLADFCESEPWPEEWLQSFRGRYSGEGEDTPGEWLRELDDSLLQKLQALAGRLRTSAEEAYGAEGLSPYGEMFGSDLAQVEAITAAATLEERLDLILGLSFVRKPAISRKKPCDEALRAELSERRDIVKKQLQSLAARYGVDLREALEVQALTDAPRRALIDLTLAFLERFSAEKERRSLADFADVEHWALQLLVRRENGSSTPTELAGELGRTFREIMIDEYQDSNLVQETILRTLSGESRGTPNLFLVGDVKQSIYKFRMARPELFLEKYKSYSEDGSGGAGRRIDLGRNFRSRPAVLHTVNRLFGHLMGEGLGGVEYDDRAALVPGAEYPAPDEPAELLVLETACSEEETRESEARLIAGRIRALTDPDSSFRLWDAGTGSFRRAEYRDIVILLRTMEGWAEPFLQVLGQEEIPAVAQQRTGYFAAREVQLLLNFLRVLDNPMQDIPLISVMLSPLGDFTSQEAAEMMAGMPEDCAYSRLSRGASLRRCSEKWERFSERIARYRLEASIRPIHELLEDILEETDYRLILAAQPDGRVRQANVERLLELAMRYEETSCHGIFSFLRNMEQLQRYQVDYGEAQVLSEQENLVRITTIHKSKGLEYPVVILAGCGKSINRMDIHSNLLIHEDLGLACDYIDPEEGLRYPVLWKKVVADRMERDLLGEELRVLYVALTRAREKLILTAALPELGRLSQKWRALRDPAEERISPALLLQANSYLDWLLMAGAGEDPEGLSLTVISAAELARRSEASAGKELLRRKLLLEMAGGRGEETFREILTYEYPWKSVTTQKTAYSVSELKHRAAEQYLETEKRDLPGEEKSRREKALWETEPDGSVPRGALRGTAYHTALEHLEPSSLARMESIIDGLKTLAAEGILTEEELGMIRPEKLLAYGCSYLGKLAAQAQEAGRMHREQPFVMQVPLSEVSPAAGAEAEGEWVLVQGIIDAFAETEDGELILWDYKTDALPKEGGEKRLLGLYTEQLRQYRRALERARGQRVREMWLYSFSLGREVRVPEEDTR